MAVYRNDKDLEFHVQRKQDKHRDWLMPHEKSAYAKITGAFT